MISQQHVAFLDGVTGFVGRWTLFWFLETLPQARVAVLIRPKGRGSKVQEEVDIRLDQVLQSIGMAAERHRVTAIAGELKSPHFGCPDQIHELKADCWIHIAGDVTYKKLGDKRSSITNRDYTRNFMETAKQVKYIPRTVCHTSTFYVFERADQPDGEFHVAEEFHDPGEMVHHNAYGFSKLEAETYLQEEVEAGALPFNLLIFRPDIVMHHIPVKEVAARNPGLIVDDFKVGYQLFAALVGKAKLKIPGGPTLNLPLKYFPVHEDSIAYMSDIDTIARSMMRLTHLFGEGGAEPENGSYSIFHLVNRWRPLKNRYFRELTLAVDPERALKVELVTPEAFREEILPNLPWAERMYYSSLVDPFIGYMHRATTHPSTIHVDALLGEDWHNLHPHHQVDIDRWLVSGGLQAIEKNFGEPPE
jgi:hypothetical protein